MNTDPSRKPTAQQLDRIMMRSPMESGHHTLANTALARKVVEDIQFLRERIERIRKLQTPNSTVLRTYQAMLESRESVLEWLKENGDVDFDDEMMSKAV